MKRSAINHTKMKRLCRELKVPTYSAVGILESLWHLTAREAPAGNIGKLSDDDIAAAVDWERPAAELTEGLHRANWIDAHPDHRYIIHDWHEHSDDAVDNQLARSGQRYANGTMPRMKRLPKSERDHLLAEFTSTQKRTELHAVRSSAHEKPLPEPEPVPEPEPGGLPVLRVPVGSVKFDHGMVSQGVLMELGLSGTHLARNLSDVAKAEIARGADGLALMGQMAESGRQYLKAKGDARLSYPVGLEKFYGEGLWRDPKLWPWKDGYKPPSRAAPDPLEEQRRERQEALNEKRRLEGNGSEPA